MLITVQRQRRRTQYLAGTIVLTYQSAFPILHSIKSNILSNGRPKRYALEVEFLH